MRDNFDLFTRIKEMRSLTPGLQYLTNLKTSDKPIVLQAIELSQRYDILWFDTPIPNKTASVNQGYGCIAIKLGLDGRCDASSFWEAYRKIEALAK